MSDTPRILYHYCSLQTFQNIIENNSIWLSDIKKSNDSKELDWIKGQCEYYIYKVWVDYVKSIKKSEFTKKVTSENFAEIDKLINLVREFRNIKTWAFCLSEKKDDLGQWRGYADDGTGISIGFKIEIFKVIRLISQYVDIDEKLLFSKVRYSKAQVKRFFYDDLELNKITPDCTPEFVIDQLRNSFILSVLNAPFFKNETFKDEKEWRLSYSMSYLGLLKGKIPVILPKTDEISYPFKSEFGYSVKNRELVSHIELKFDDIGKHIYSITLGPKSKMSSIEMKEYLIFKGLIKNIDDKSIKVVKSGSTYR